MGTTQALRQLYARFWEPAVPKTDVAPAPTEAQWQTAQEKLTELLQALKDAQAEIERLTAENLKLHSANDDLQGA